MLLRLPCLSTAILIFPERNYIYIVKAPRNYQKPLRSVPWLRPDAQLLAVFLGLAFELLRFGLARFEGALRPWLP